MAEIDRELAEVKNDTGRLGTELVAAIKATPEGVEGGGNFARLLPIKFATDGLRAQYIGVGGWTENSQAIEVSKISAVGDNQLWFHPTSGDRMREI